MTAKPLHIILAEDDDGHATLVQRNLERSGLVNGFTRLRDGQETIDYLFAQGVFAGQTRPEQVLLLLDINMPKLDGIEVLKKLREDPRTEMLPVIMLTTTDDPREIQRCYQLGCNVYVTKPVDYQAFVEAIRRLGLFLQVVAVPYNGGRS